MEELMAKYLADELSEKEKIQFDQNLAENDGMAEELELSLNAWHAVQDANGISTDVNKAWDKVSSQISETKETKVISLERKPKYTLLKIAATLLIILSTGYFLSDSTGVIDSESQLIELTAVAGFEEFQLPDGSAIKLKANSSIAYAKGFGIEHRELILIGGANFDVTKNKDVPFIIRTDKSVVKVLGTSFDLSAYPEKEVELHVTEGLVNFTAAANENVKNEIPAGKKAVLMTEGNDIVIEDLNSKNYSAWWTGQLVFNNTPLKQVVKDLEKTFSVSISLKGDLGDCPLNATYSKSSINEIVVLIQATLEDSQIEVTYTKENSIILDGKACTN